MKKFTFMLMIITFVIISCKKEHSPPAKPASKAYKITFNIADFTQTISATAKIKTKSVRTDAVTSDVSAYATTIYYAAYDSTGNLTSAITQNTGVSNFGLIADHLPAGKYTIVISAGQNQFSLATGGLYPSYKKLNDSYFYYAFNQNKTPFERLGKGPWFDTFYKKIQITVGNTDISQTVNLDRLVSKLEVDFLDVIPSNAKRLSVLINKEYFQYNPGADQPALADTITTNYTIPDSVKGTSNYKIGQIVLNTANSFTVTLTAFDNSNNIIATHAVTNVTCQKNKRTILTGNFGNLSNNGFSISLNADWGDPLTSHF